MIFKGMNDDLTLNKDLKNKKKVLKLCKLNDLAKKNKYMFNVYRQKYKDYFLLRIEQTIKYSVLLQLSTWTLSYKKYQQNIRIKNKQNRKYLQLFTER